MKKILITGGAGFIGSHLCRLFVNKYPNYMIYNLDSLTYAGNLYNTDDFCYKSNYKFLHGDIRDANFLDKIFELYQFDSIINLAAESHVDNSIESPMKFAETNVIGTINLLELSRKNWTSKNKNLFYHVSTDEVYGSLGDFGLFTEESNYSPNSPYSASKASSDHFVRAYGETFNLPYVISNCSNNYGPNQFPEKLIPKIINCVLEEKNIPVYGNGKNIRDWLFVEDHVEAIDLIFHKSKSFQTYNIGGNNEVQNIDLVKKICDLIDLKLNNTIGKSRNLISFVKDRAGHDLRYAIDSSKIKNNLDWSPKFNLTNALDFTVSWYMKNKDWLDNINNGTYLNYKINTK